MGVCDVTVSQRSKVLHVLRISSYLFSYLRFPGNYLLLFVFSQVKNLVLWESTGLSNRSFLNICIKKEGQSTSALKWGKGMPRRVLKLPPKSILHLFQYAEEWVIEVPNFWHEMWLQVSISASAVLFTNTRGRATTLTSLNIFFF